MTCDRTSTDDVFEELGTRLYEWSDSHARSLSLFAKAFEPQQPWLLRGLRISDIIVDLLRYKWQYDILSPSRQEYRQARLDSLLEALRKPWIRCSIHSSEATLPTGVAPCESCRFSLLSIAGNINTLALGFAATSGLSKEEKDVESAEDSKEVAEPKDTKSKLHDVQSDLDKTSSELASLKTELGVIEFLADETESKLSEATKLSDDLQKEKSEAETLLKAGASAYKFYNGMAETVKTAIDIAHSSQDSDTDNPITKWQMAETLLQSLIDRENFLLTGGIAMAHASEDGAAKKRQTSRKDADVYRLQRVRALLHVGNDAALRNAKPLAKQLLDRRRKNLGKTAQATKEIFWDYCQILTKLNEQNAVELEYQQVWLSNAQPVDIEFRERAGLELAQLKENLKQRDEAAVWYRKVAAHRLERGDGPLAAAAALKTVPVHGTFHLSPESSALLTKIWDDYKGGNPPLSRDILSCGQEVGTMLASAGKYQEATAELMIVWKALEKHGDAGLEERMHVALALADIASEGLTGEDADLRQLADWLHTNFTKSGKDKKVTLNFAHGLGCLQIGRGQYKDAEKTLKSAWIDAKKISKNDEITIDIGLAYAQALESQPSKLSEARIVVNEVWMALKSIWTKPKKPARSSSPEPSS